MSYPLIVILLLLTPSLSAGETVYRYRDSQGSIHFTDRPPAVEGKVEVIQRDPSQIHQRLDEAGVPLFENFSRSQLNPSASRPSDESKLVPSGDDPAAERKRSWASPLELVKGSLTTLLKTFVPLFGLVLIAIGLPLVLQVVLARLKGRIGEECVAKLLDRQGYEALHDVIIDDRAGGSTQIDHLLRLKSGLLVIETKNYSGMISGREKEPTWTQRIGRRSYKFQNPLRQSYKHTETLRQYLPNLPIHNRVVFVGDAEFPNGRPANVLTLKDLPLEVDSLQLLKIDPQDMEDAWRQVSALAKSDQAARRRHLKQLREKHGGKPRLTIGISCITVGLLVLLFL